MKRLLIFMFSFLRPVRKRAGGTWYHIVVWDENYDHYAGYWTRDKEREYEWFGSGRKINKTECYG